MVFFAVLKVWNAETVAVDGSVAKRRDKIMVIFFFIFHFGGFTMIHRLGISALFAKEELDFLAAMYGVVGLFISHGISYYSNYIQKEERKKFDLEKVVFMPYKRIVVLQFTLVFGATLMSIFHLDAMAVTVLIVMKTGLDAYLHKREHQKIE